MQDVEGCGFSGLPLAFSRAEGMVAYLEAHGNSRWDVRCVSREAGLEAFADLHESGYALVCMDPETDGSGGQELTLAELIMVLRKDAE
jgi:hypothetical protein